MTDILHQSSSHLPSPSNNDGFGQLNHSPLISPAPVDLYGSNYCRRIQQEVESGEEEGGQDDFSVLALLLIVFRKSLVGCKNISGENCDRIMEIGWPTNVRHIAHVTFDRFNGFLGLPVEFEPEVPRRPPSASTRVFGVSTESMQLSDDPRGNCVPTILLMMQKRLYLQCGLQSEGIFRINSDNGQEEYAREQINNGGEPSDEDGHHSTSRPRNHVEGNEDEEAEAVKEPPLDQIMSPTSQAESRICHGQTHGFLNSIENILSEGKGDNDHLPAEIPNSVGTTRDNGVERVNSCNN